MERRATDAEPLATIFVAPNRSAPGGDPFVTDIACTTPARSDICPFVAIWASLIRKEPRAGLLAPRSSPPEGVLDRLAHRAREPRFAYRFGRDPEMPIRRAALKRPGVDCQG